MGPDEEALYAKHAPELLRFATTLVGPVLAEDILAGAVLRVFASPSWRSARNPRPYLFRAVLNEARQHARSERRRHHREQVVAATAQPEEANTSTVDVFDAMRRLSVRQRAVVFTVFWLDLPVRDAAAMLGMSLATTERDLRRAKQRLEDWLR